MTPEVLVPLLWLSALLVTLEVRYAPRLGFTRERDVLLWYTKGYERTYLHLFKI